MYSGTVLSMGNRGDFYTFVFFLYFGAGVCYNRPMIKIVLIDIDNTLLDFDKCAKDSIKKACEVYSLPFAEEIFSAFIPVNDSLWREIEKGTLTKKRLHEIRFWRVFEAAGVNADGNAFEKTFREFLETSHEKVDGAEELLSYLSTKYRVYAVSNAAHFEQLTRLERAGLSRYISDCFVSEVLGAEKPSAKFFDACFLRIADAEKENTVVIGDSLSADMIGGKNYGLKTIWFNKKGAPSSKIPDYTVYSLAEIKNIL